MLIRERWRPRECSAHRGHHDTVPAMRRVLLALLPLLTATMLVGCQAEVATHVDVSDQAQASLTVSASFRGDAAVALREDPDLVGDLTSLFTERGATEVQTFEDNDQITVTGQVDYDALTQAADITGIRRASLTSTGEQATVALALSQPQALVAALSDQAARAAANEADAQALTATFLATTLITVQVSFPGPVSTATAPELESFVAVEGNTATLSAPLVDMTGGDFTVTGDLQGSSPLIWWIAAVVAVLAAVGVFVLRRR